MTVFVHCSNVLLDWVDRLRTMQQSVNFFMYMYTTVQHVLYSCTNTEERICKLYLILLSNFEVLLFVCFWVFLVATEHLLRLESSFRTIIAHNVNSNCSSAQRCLKLGLLCKLKPLYRRHFEFTSTICIVSSANIFFIRVSGKRHI